jgi:hypothetical protein
MSDFDFMQDLPPLDVTGLSPDELIAKIATLDPELKTHMIAALDAEIEQRQLAGNVADYVLAALRIVRALFT